MNRPTIHRIAILILAVVGISTAGVIALLITVGGSVLEGESHHHFGTVVVDSPSSTFEHTFHLINESDKPIVIDSAKPSCSCTTVELSTRVLEPGDAVDVATRMTLKASAHRKITVTLALSDERLHNLQIEANARLRQQLRSSATFLRLASGGSAMTIVWVEVWDDPKNAPEPKLVTPEGVTAKFTRWDLQRKGSEQHGAPANWSGKIVIEQQAQELPADAAMTVQFKSNEPVMVRLLPALPQPSEIPAEPPLGDG